jgi:hypothetical protein
MARIFRGQASTITHSLVVLPALLFSALPSAMAQLYEQPVLVVDPDMHTAADDPHAGRAKHRIDLCSGNEARW